jgi:uncharacterized membrane protein YhhN
MLVAILTSLAIISGVTATLTAHRTRRTAHYIFKPLTILFIIAIALIPKHTVSAFYRYALILGLLFSLAGDIFLMLKRDYFVQGLVSFFVAHLFYTAAFLYESGAELPFLSMAPFMLYGGLMLRVLWPYLGKMRLPLLAYMIVILLMGWTATGRWIWAGRGGSLLAAAGALLFIASDSLLALDKFRGRFRAAQFLILATYFAAQWLIALST